MISVEKYKVQFGVPDTEFIFNTLEEAQKFANEEGSASGIKTTIIKFEVVEESNNLWKDITKKSTDDGHNTFIILSDLRKILEEYKILEQEKGM